jgi:hypothetical protein
MLREVLLGQLLQRDLREPSVAALHGAAVTRSARAARRAHLETMLPSLGVDRIDVGHLDREPLPSAARPYSQRHRHRALFVRPRMALVALPWEPAFATPPSALASGRTSKPLEGVEDEVEPELELVGVVVAGLGDMRLGAGEVVRRDPGGRRGKSQARDKHAPPCRTGECEPARSFDRRDCRRR